MIVHIIVDYSYLYYKYKFQLDAGKIRRLTAVMDVGGVNVEKDVSQIYYSIKEIEGFRRNMEKAGNQVVVSICFDMPSKRKEEETVGAENYKSNRVHHLKDEDFENIRIAEKLLHDAGHNTYRYEGYEADDIVSHLVKEYTDLYDRTVIYTPDADLLVNLGPKVSAMRYKSRSGYASVSMDNFSEYLSQELKCDMPYNAIMLFKATVGDPSDCIQGIKKFGPKAFDKLVETLSNAGINWPVCGNYKATLEILNSPLCGFSDVQKSEALQSLELVRPQLLENVEIHEPVRFSTMGQRDESYSKYGMKSLVD